MLKEKKIVIINKFFKNDGRFHALVEMLGEVQFDPALLDSKDRALLKKVTWDNSKAKEFIEPPTLAF